MRKTFAALAAVLSLAAAPAVADNLYNDDWTFNFMNDSSATVVYFATVNPNGQWSKNWLKTAVAAGTGLTLNFYDRGDTRCEVRTYVRFSDQSHFDEVVDYCDIAIVTVRDGGLYTE